MGFSETIRLLIDVDSTSGTGAIKNFRTQLSETDGAFNKVKLAGSSAFDFVGRHAATFALGAGGAIAGFAAHAVSSFQDAALGAGKLRDALGLSAEEASRFQEVAGDLGIGVGALESTIGRMNRVAEKTPEAFDQIGAAIARNKDGSINVQETFLNVVDALNAIPDASVRAAAAQEIFGRSWQDIAELVMMGADGMRDALASVEDQKVFSPAEIERGREFRDMMDTIRGKAEELALGIGEGLTESFLLLRDAALSTLGFVEARMEDLSSLADNMWPDDMNPFDSGGPVGTLAADFGEAARAAEDAMTVFSDVQGPFLSTGDALAYAAEQTHKVRRGTDDMATGFVGLDPWLGSAAEKSEALAFRAREARDTLEEQTAAIEAQADAVIASLDSGIALNNAQRDAAEQFAATNEQILAQAGVTAENAQALDDAKSSALDVAGAQVQLAEDTAIAEGRTFTHADKVKELRDSLLDQASSIEGPVHDALMELVATLDTIPEEAGPTVTVPGATESTAQLRETGDAATELSDAEQVVTTAPGATESTAQLRETDRTARGMTNDEQVETTAPGATESTAQIRETDRAARTLSNDEQVETSAPGATNATGQLQDVDSAARQIPGFRNVEVNADDNASGILGRIKDAIDAIRSKTVVVTVENRSIYTGSFGEGAAKGTRSSGPGDFAGEAGPELLKFKRGGQAIVNQPTFLPLGTEVIPLGGDSFANRAGAGGGMAGTVAAGMAATSIIINSYVTVSAPLGQHPAEWGRRIQEALLADIRLNGGAQFRKAIGV